VKLLTQTKPAFHGGKSFEAIGEDFQSLKRGVEVIRGDVLDAWFDPSPKVLQKLREFLPFLVKSSPPADGKGLVESISRARGIPHECVLIGAGSSDLIFTCLPSKMSQS
jgi:histidinol-phosphate/aromatic aminotransferase/cobyric acid decarboxylase-like protein